MSQRMAVVAALVALILCLPVWQNGERAEAAEVNILPYYAAGKTGDFWTYSFIYIDPAYLNIPGFTVNLNQVTSGPLAGKYRSGDWVDLVDSPHIRWNILDWDASGINIYATESNNYNPPIKVAAMQPLNILSNGIPDSSDHVHVLQRLASLSVLAGTFSDIVVDITLTKLFGPSSANAEFGLDSVSFPYQVTHVVWYAAGIGEIQNRDYEPAPGGKMLFEYQLQATSVPLPGSLALMGTGLLRLFMSRRRSKR